MSEFSYSQSPFVFGEALSNHYPYYATYDGVLAVGGDVMPQTLLKMYSAGLFPWYNQDEDPILWWSPDPRLVLFPSELKVQRSMRTYFNNATFTVTYNTCFEQIMRHCQLTPRNGRVESWINEELVHAFTTLHQQGFAHSVEVWQNNSIVGGLYGLAIGKIFSGESMFALVPNASKFGFISWVNLLKSHDFFLVDCQTETRHLRSLGAETITRNAFKKIVQANQLLPANYLQTQLNMPIES